MDIKIKILDPVHCQAVEGIELLKPLLSCDKVFWRRGRFGKRKKIQYRSYLIDKEGIFLTGFLPKIRTYCERQNISPVIKGKTEKLKFQAPKLSGIIFRQDQIDAIENAGGKQRGVIKAPTRAGKSIIIMGIFSSFPRNRFLLIAHTLEIVGQLQDDVDRFGFSDRVDVGTIQTWSKKEPEEFCDKYDGVIVDEAHHCGNLEGHYTSLLHRMLSPLRIGFTATLPPGKAEQMTLEGTLGPVIGELTMKEAAEKGIITRPKIRLEKVPKSEKVRRLRKYQDVYEAGIVFNRSRNRLIIKEARSLIGEGNTVLILVVRIAHGEALVDLAKRIYEMDIPFVQGVTDSEVRLGVKKALADKEIKCVIATAVFREGVNIPSLNSVINGCGGKSEVMTLQAVGRGLTVVEGKEESIIVDFLDLSHPYLISHIAERLSLYSDMEWL